MARTISDAEPRHIGRPGKPAHLDDAAGRYADLGVPDAALDRCTVLLAAGLPADALAGVETALTGPVTATKQAELLLAAARIALAAGHHNQAAERSSMARSMFTAQHRELVARSCHLRLLQARFLAGRLLPEARRTAVRPGEPRSDEAPDAWLLAGRIALALRPPARSAGRPRRERRPVRSHLAPGKQHTPVRHK